MIVFRQHVPFEMADPVRKGIGIVGRHRTHREHVAGQAIEHYRRARIGAEPPRGIFLKRSEEHTSELQSLMRISYAVFCLKKKTKTRKAQSIQRMLQCHTDIKNKLK